VYGTCNVKHYITLSVCSAPSVELKQTRLRIQAIAHRRTEACRTQVVSSRPFYFSSPLISLSSVALGR